MNTKGGGGVHEQDYNLEARLLCPFTSYTKNGRKHKLQDHVNEHTGV